MNLTQRSFARLTWAAAAGMGVFLLWLAFHIGGPPVTDAVDDLGELVAALAAAYAGWRRSVREDGSLRRGWLLLSGSALAWGLGEAAWSYYDLVAGRAVPFPSLADLGYLAAMPLALAGMLAFFRPPRGWTSRLRILTDGLIVGGAILFLSWSTALGAVLRAGEGNAAVQAIGLAYPIGDIVIISTVFLVGARDVSRSRLPLGWISIALLALAVSDSAFAYLTQQGTWSPGVLDAGWFAGYVILALAAVKPPPGTGSARRGGELTALPYVPVVVMLGLLGSDALAGRPLSGFPLWNAGAVVAFLVIRQILTLAENRTLTADLEAKVEARTTELRCSEERLRSLIQNVSDVIGVVEADGTIRYMSPSVQTVFGYEPSEMVGQNHFAFLHPDDSGAVASFLAGSAHRGPTYRLAMRFRHCDGTWRHTEAVGVDMSDDPALGGFVFTTRDVTQREEFQRQLIHQAFHDPLTGLANRALLAERMEHALTRSGRTGCDLTVMFVDIDDLKSINDTLGHAWGDALLAEAAQRLEACLRPGDTVARVGGDEFAALMEDSTEEQAVAVAERLRHAFAEPLLLDGSQVHLSASVGIATSGPDTKSAAEVLRNADVAMYRAKSGGKARHAVFRPEMHRALISRDEQIGALRHAVEGNDFELHHQPIVDLVSGRVVGFEALVRWQHPTRGMVTPEEFMVLAEDTGLILPLGRWILEEALAQLAAWDRLCRPGPPLTINVNVAGRQLQSLEFVSTVADVLTRSGIEPARLILELSESMLPAGAGRPPFMIRQLKELGVGVAVDDFGAGFSLLRYSPVDMLTIGRSFVDDLGTARGASLARTLIETADAFGLDTVAKGIERPGQARVLRASGCRLGQGGFFSPPLRPADAEALLRAEPMAWSDPSVTSDAQGGPESADRFHITPSPQPLAGFRDVTPDPGDVRPTRTIPGAARSDNEFG